MLLPACEMTDRAIFVTSSTVGVSADIASRQITFGYDRTEGYIGPAYVEEGIAPPIFGYHQSDLGVLDAKIRQVYATGEAAILVTGGKLPEANPVAFQPDPGATGKRRVMFVGTTSNLGLRIGFSNDLPDVNLGYKRKEISAIPFRAADPDRSKNEQDIYAPVLSAMNIDSKASTYSSSNFGVTQLIATGAAAKNLARQDDIRNLITMKTEKVVTGTANQNEATSK